VPDDEARKALLRLAQGQPTFFLVEAVRLVQTGTRLSALRRNEFVHTVLRHSVRQLTGGRPELEEALVVLAAASPVRQDTEGLLDALGRLLERRKDEVARLIDELVERGAVDDRAGYYRVVPPLLGEYLLASRCLDRRGRTTRYHERLLESSLGVAGKQLVARWRRSRSARTRASAARWWPRLSPTRRPRCRSSTPPSGSRS
jgi:hypothetical protein